MRENLIPVNVVTTDGGNYSAYAQVGERSYWMGRVGTTSKEVAQNLIKMAEKYTRENHWAIRLQSRFSHVLLAETQGEKQRVLTKRELSAIIEEGNTKVGVKENITSNFHNFSLISS